MYERGQGVSQDFVQAHMWYNLSAAHGEQRAAEIRDALARQMTASQIAEAQRLAVEWKPKDRLGDYLRKLAEAGDASAQNALGLLYYEGRGVPRNYGQAKEWFEKGAEQGHAGAQVNLGTLYLHGDGAPQSTQTALVWFGRAAAQRDALAFAKLGRMYERGQGVSQDFIQAQMWYNLSAAHGEQRAAEIRDALARQMTASQIAEAQRLAVEWKSKDRPVVFQTTAIRSP
jgi:TPR repeat protein